MADSDYTIRSYSAGDLQGCIDLWMLEGRDQTGHCISPQTIEMQLDKPGFTAEETVLVAVKDECIIGCLNITPEISSKRAVIHCIVHPKCRRHGVASALIGEAAKRIIDLGATVISTDILENNKLANNLLYKLGFKPVRSFIEMEMDLDIEPAIVTKPNIEIRHLAPNETSVLADLQNRAFAQHWGYSPNTAEEIKYWLSRGDQSCRNVIVACLDNRLVGYCWTAPLVIVNPSTGRKHSTIHMLGVDPGYQKKNIGKAVLVGGLSSLFNRGVEVVEITADSLNEKALALYKSIGFRQRAISQCYEKVLRQVFFSNIL